MPLQSYLPTTDVKLSRRILDVGETYIICVKKSWAIIYIGVEWGWGLSYRGGTVFKIE